MLSAEELVTLAAATSPAESPAVPSPKWIEHGILHTCAREFPSHEWPD